METGKSMEIYPFLFSSDKDEVVEKVTPSHYIRELSRSTAERTEILMRHGAFVKKYTKKTFPFAFKPSIPVVIFQSFAPENVYAVSLSLLNTDKVIRYLTMQYEKSPYFLISYCSQAMIKVAPGMSEKFLIKFKPLEKKDYHHKVSFHCEEGSFEISLIAIGPRPLLDFPDVIQMGECPVNMPTTNFFCVVNNGEVDAVFKLIAPSPFQVHPINACLKSGENIQISVILNSAKAGIFEEFISIVFENGEELHSSIIAIAKNSSVTISDEKLQFEDTFMGLSRKRVVSIHNNSSHVVNFKWKQFSSIEEDKVEAERKTKISDEMSGAGDARPTLEVAADTNGNVTSTASVSFVYFEECILDTESLFHDPYFSFLQKEGDIWPGCSTDIQVIFMPKIGQKKYECVAYCETSGCESRHKLEILGTGLGPKIDIFPTHLDIGGVYATVKNSYEVIVSNKGDISGQIEFISKPLDFSGTLECNPQILVLEPAEYKAIALAYIGLHKGQIIEEVMFKICESGEVRTLFFSGNIQFAELKLDKTSIDLGMLPVSIPIVTSVLVENPTLIPISFVAFVAGYEVAHQKLTSDWRYSFSLLNIPQAQEVFVDPTKGFLKPSEALDLNIRILPEAHGYHSAHIVVDMWEGKASPLVILVKYKTLIPEVSLVPQEINLTSCFLRQTYKQCITLVNSSDCPAKYSILPDEMLKNENISLSLEFFDGILAEQSSVKIHVFIEVYNAGTFMCTLKVKVSGMIDILTCKITCEGQGPRVITEINELFWGYMPLFESDTKSFKIQNYSSILAEFSCAMKNDPSPWKVQPKKGSIDPLDVATISLELYLVDRGVFEDSLIISVGNTYDLTIDVYATGYGSPVVTDPPISPILDLGKIFCFSSFSKRVKFTNYGCCLTTLIFSHGNKKMKKAKSENNSTVFDFSPSKLILGPGDSDFMFLQASHDRAEEVSESFYFWSYAEGRRKKEQILNGVVTAIFIPLVVTFSPEKIYLLSHKNSVVRETLTVTNETCISTMFTFSTEHPFFFAHGQKSHASLEVDMPPHEFVDILVEFDPSFLNDYCSRTFNGTVTIAVGDMPQEFQHHVKVTGHVEFPHISIHFGKVDFGCIVAGSLKKKVIKICNDSIFPAEFCWKWINGSAFVGYENFKASSITSDPSEEDLDDFTEFMVDALALDVNQAKGDYLRRMQVKIISNLFDDIEEEDNEKHLSLYLSENKKSFPVSWVFDVMPKYGILDPHQSLDAFILFRGHVPLKASAVLSLEVTQGAPEKVVISGRSFNISYFLDKTCLNFHGNIFCLPASDKIKLSNRGACRFYYSIDYGQSFLDGPESSMNEVPCSFEIDPSSGFIDGHSSVTLQVSCIPGRLGHFIGICKLCLPVVEPIHISASGYGLLPQVFLHLEKDLSVCEEEWSPISEYNGISLIGEDWKPKDVIHDIDWAMFISVDLEKIDEKDWVWISFEDEFPTKIDICLAIEWGFARQYVKNYSWCTMEDLNVPRTTSIPGLCVSPYTISLGMVLIGQESTYCFVMENFGPVTAHVYIRKKIREKMCVEGFTIDLLTNKVPVGDSTMVDITLCPSREAYPDNHYVVKSTLYIDVVFGASIPINIYAEVTIPFITLEENNYNFDQVICGQCKTHSFTIQNRGWVISDWKLCMTLVRRTTTKFSNKSAPHKMKKKENQINPFRVSPEIGKLKPGEVTTLEILFEPHCGGPFEAELAIKVIGNQDVIKMTLKGIGLDPVLKFNSTEINFGPIISQTEKSSANVFITNPNKYPVEIFVPLFDRLINEEERIFQLLLHYYKTDTLMIPAASIGERYSEMYRDFYLWISELLLKEMFKRSQSLAIASVDSIEKPTKVSRRRSSGSRTRKSVSSSHVDDKASVDVFNPASEKNQIYLEAALEKYFSGELLIPDIENKMQDPVRKLVDNLSGKEHQKRGSIDSRDSAICGVELANVYVFHGAPYSDSVQIAHRASRKLKLPVFNLDDIIIEAAVSGASTSGSEVKNILENSMSVFFSKFSQLKGDEATLRDVGRISQSVDSDIDPVEEFSNKLATYLVEAKKANSVIVAKVEDTDDKSSHKKKGKGSKSSKASSAKSSKGSSKKKAKTVDSDSEKPVVEEPSPVPLTTTLWTELPSGLFFPNIPEFLIEEILSARLQQPEFCSGFVVPTLWSVFFPSVDRVLLILLKITSKNFTLNCTFIRNTFENHVDILKERMTDKECKECHKKDFLLSIDTSENHQCASQLEGMLGSIENYCSLKKSDKYLQAIKIKLNQVRKFYGVMKFVEVENFASKKGKKSLKVTIKKSLANGNNSLRSAASRVSSQPQNNAKKAGKKGAEESKTKTSKPIPAHKSKVKKGESEEKEDIGVSMPFPLEVCDAIGLDVGQTVNLWNQFDDFDSELRQLLHLLESWSETLEKRLFPSDKERHKSSRDSKGRMSKTYKRLDLLSALQNHKKKSKDSHKMDDEDTGLPVAIVNSSDIESDVVKSFLGNMMCSQGFLSFDHRSLKNYYDCGSISKSPDITFLHIKKQWFDRTKELLENSFSISSLDVTNIFPNIVKTQDLIIEVERIKPPEEVLSGEADNSQVLPLEKRSLRNSEISKEELPKEILDPNQYVSENVNAKESNIMSSLQVRQLLSPGESVGYRICYTPIEKGVHKSSLYIELSGWRKTYNVNMSGISDVPQLDTNPEVIFSKCSLEKPKSPNALYSPTFFHNIETLDFGLLPVEKKFNVCAVSKLNFKNISQVSVKAKFILEQNQGNFILDGDELDLEANECGIIKITVSPKYPHQVQETLVCSVNDNPEVINLKLAYVGYTVKVQLQPKQLNFGQVLIFRKHWLNLSLKNLCASSLYWHITSSDFINGEGFIARPIDGLLDIFSTSEIEVEFAPKKVQLVSKKPLSIELFARKGDTAPLLSETVNVSGEAYDVNVDISFAYCDKNTASFAKSSNDEEEEIEPNHLDFGLMRAETERCMLIALGNRGKRSVNFVILEDEDKMLSLGYNLSEVLSIEPRMGSLETGSRSNAAIIFIKCFSTVEADIKHLPILKCRLIDPNVYQVENQVVADIPVNVTLKAVYSKYNLKPSTGLNFGVVKTGAQKTLTIVISNKGEYEFTFSIKKTPVDSSEEIMEVKKINNKRNSIGNASPKQKNKGHTELTVGCFRIVPASGFLHSDEAQSILVHCEPESEGTFEEGITISVSDTHPSEPHSKMHLSATSFYPAIDFSAPEKIFIEHIVCEDFRSFKWPSKAISYTVYSKKDNELAFKGVYVNHTVEARICLHNCSLIPADVEISIQSCKDECTTGCYYLNTKNNVDLHVHFWAQPNSCGVAAWTLQCYKGHARQVQIGRQCYREEITDKKQAVDCFEVIPKFAKVPPCSDEWITVTFSPRGTEISFALLEIIVESDSESAWSCLLSGEGLLPELTLTYPINLQKNAEGKYPFILPERLVGSYEKFIFSFKNSGCITCKVIIEFNGDERYFQIFPEKNTDNFLKEFQITVPLKKLTTFDLRPDEEVTFWFSFFGYHPASFEEDILICAVGSLFGSIAIEVNAVCISEGVHIEGLDHVKKHLYSFDYVPEKNSSTSSSSYDESKRTSSFNPSSNFSDEKSTISPQASFEETSIEYSVKSNDRTSNITNNNSNEAIFSRYLLDFKKCYIGVEKVVRFWVINHSKLCYYFQWFGLESLPQLLLYPHKGIIESFSSVTITAVCLSEEPVIINQAILRCCLFEMVEIDKNDCCDEEVARKFVEMENAELDKAEAEEVEVEEEETIYNLIEQNTNIDSTKPSEDTMNEHDKEIIEIPENIQENIPENIPKYIPENIPENMPENISESIPKKISYSSFKCPQDEPEKLESSDSSQKMSLCEKKERTVNREEFFYINIIMSAVFDYRKCISTAPHAIAFGDVLISESRKHSVALTNVGSVPLKFVWKFRSLVYFSLSKFVTHKYNYCRITKLIKRKGKEHAVFISLRGRNSKRYYTFRNGCILKPFQVIPRKGSLKGTGDKSICDITFTPLTTGYYRAVLYCRINKPCHNPIVSKTLLEGVGKRKKYYFNCDTENGGCGRNMDPNKPFSEVCSAPDPEKETVELHVIGVGVRCYKKLQFHHLSHKRSIFNWKSVDEENLNALEWRCRTPNGIAFPKSVTQMEFSFTPLKVGTFESKWSFSLFHNQKKCLHKIFHFIGIASEPAVYFTENCIKIHQVVPGQSIFKNAYFVNEEEVTIRFKVYGNLKAIKNDIGTLKIKPQMGVLKPQHSTKIRLTFTPEKAGKTYFHLKFKIQKRQSPVVLTVFCDSYDIRAEAKFLLPALSLLRYLSEDKPNDIRFGRIQEKTSISGTFELYNKGLNAFDYSWSYKVLLAREIGLDIKITNVVGNVPPASKVDCCLKVSLSHKSRIENYPLILKVIKGPTYHIYLSMVASSPLCRFSFLCHDFGLCLLSTAKPISRGKEVILTVTGYDKNPIMLECNFNPLCYLTVDFKRTTLLFNETAKIPITFCPQDYVRYSAVIPFTINGRWKRSVIIKGQAVPLKLELVRTRDLSIEFKAVKAGEIVSKILPVTNKTLVPIDVRFGLGDDTDCEDDWNRMTILPNSSVTMAKGDVIDIIITFSPMQRMARFTEKVVAFVNDLPEEHPLFICHASCEEVDIVLNNPCVQFGRVPKGITAVVYVSLMNDGDIGKRYQWDRKRKLNKQFSITPNSGFLNANQSTSFRITFRPTSVNSYVKCKICCEVKHYKKIYLDISGFGHELPSPTEKITFTTLLRECDTKFVTIKNSSDDQMELIPYFCGEYFEGANVLLIEPSSESLYEICYYPKSMKASSEHHGKLYFHLPSGENYSWNLIGSVKPPLPCSMVKREAQTGVWHSEILCVKNSLSEPQRFIVHTELMPGKDGEPPFSITGYSGVSSEDTRRSIRDVDSKENKHDVQTKLKEEGSEASVTEDFIGGSGEPGGFIDVPANSETSYKVNFICFRECELSFKVFFVCKETAEYQYHDLDFTVTEKNPDVFKITTSVFKKLCRTLDVTNPFSSTPLNFYFICDLDFISLPDPVSVPPNCKETIVLQVFPLFDGHFEGTLTVTSPEIGDVTHVLDVKVLPLPLDEYPSFEFTAPLGSSGGPSKPIVLCNYSKTEACFSCKVDSSEFFVDDCVFVRAASEEILDVTYEPTKLGFTQAVLKAESKSAGSFGFRLCGAASSPKIKGPFKVVANSEGIDILFKNILKTGMDFSVTVTEPFRVNVSSVWIESMEEKAVTVSLDLPDDEHPSQPITGSLIIMPISKEIHSSTRWEYYLMGVFV